MNVLELMDSKASSFSKTERKIYESIKKFPESFATESITKISYNSGFTKPALTRFAQKLGFSGYVEFQYQFNKDKDELSKTNDESLADIYTNIIRNTEAMICDEDLDKIVEKLSQSRAIFIKGSNLSRLPAEELQISISFDTGYLPIFVQQDVLPNSFREDDVLIVYSARSGDSHQDICRFLRNPEMIHPYTILITTNAKHPLRHNFKQVVVLPSISLSVGKGVALSDTFAFLYFNERLVQKIKKGLCKNL